MYFLFTIIVILTIFLLRPCLKKYRENKRISFYIDALPGEKCYPLIGSSLSYFKISREDLFETVSKKRHAQYGPIVRNWYGSFPVVHIYKPEHAQVIFKSGTIINKGNVYRFLFPWLGQGLISGSGSTWKAHRKIITPSFHFKILDNYGEIFAEKSEAFVKYLKKYDGQDYFEVTNVIAKIALDIISETAMGVKLHLLESGNEGTEYANALSDFCEIACSRIKNLLLQNDLIFRFTKQGRKSQKALDIIHSFNKKVITQRKEYFQKNKNELLVEDELGRKQKVSFLDMLLVHQENNNFTDTEIEHEVNTFLFGGQDTTVATLTFAFVALGNYPDILKRVQEELDHIFADDPFRKITPKDINEMEYLDRVVKEVLRFFCFVPFLGRYLEEDVEIDGVLIPKGVNVIIDLFDLHHDPDHYPEPYKFDPDRFLPENSAERHPYAYAPFSAGARNCLGQKFAIRNVKTLLSYILRKYNVKCQEHPEDLRYYADIVLRPQNGVHIKIESRK
ncbi:cytochrome P450 4C1-like isoform X2 [Anthonomus grandis grandis]|uniref:cytochrome P450 4C1-like isoform X2 n=1 Tax=Anthonomus grandis grandis TaxID=2921223 RepID=UPI0021660B4C|nr:cytochrome P450 4C1-like isoform X2 [Anthonomus grandis grandis]